MRENFKKMAGQRHTFIATVSRFGKKSSYRGPPQTTILLVNIKNENEGFLEDHAWMVLRKRFEQAEIKEGDVLKLEARVSTYVKGYSDDHEENPIRIDYKLCYPTKIMKIGEDEEFKISEHAIIQQKLTVPMLQEPIPESPTSSPPSPAMPRGRQTNLIDFLNQGIERS